MMYNPVEHHPNASLSSVASSFAVLTVWLINGYWIGLNAVDGAFIAGLVTTLALVLGKKGLRSIIMGVWWGDGKNG